MPSPLVTTLLAFAAILAALSAPVAAIVLGSLAVVIEVVIFILSGIDAS